MVDFVKRIIEALLKEEQEDLGRRRRGFVGQIFALKQIMEKALLKKEVSAFFH